MRVMIIANNDSISIPNIVVPLKKLFFIDKNVLPQQFDLCLRYMASVK